MENPDHVADDTRDEPVIMTVRGWDEMPVASQDALVQLGQVIRDHARAGTLGALLDAADESF